MEAAAAAVERGLAHHRAGRVEAAIAEYAAALAADPANVDALNLRGIAEHQRGDNAAAVDLLRRALALRPDFAGALLHLGDVLLAMDDAAGALSAFLRLEAVAPDWHGGAFGRARALERLGDRPGALAAYDAALARDAGFVPALFARANLRAGAGDVAGGLADMRAAVAAAPDQPENRNGLAAILALAGDADGAAAAYAAALELAPGHPGALFGLGQLDLARGRLAAAGESARRLAESHPGSIEAVLLAGEVAHREGRLTRALTILAPALLAWAGVELPPAVTRPQDVLAPLRAAALRLSGFRHMHPVGRERLGMLAGRLGSIVANFGDFATAGALLETGMAHGVRECAQNRAALALYDPALGPGDLARIHGEFAGVVRMQAGAPADAAAPAIVRGRARLRVGYLSSDFRHHSVAKNIRPLFARHDRKHFEVAAYSLVEARDATTDWFRARADIWRDLAGRSDAAIAAAIRADAPDILVHVAGHFDANRLGVAVHRPARVQASLYDAATSGLPEIDLLFADRVQVPRASPEWFAERVVRLPNLYLHEPIVGAPDIPARPADAPPAFASFSNPVKLNARVLALWARVLAAVPAATLVLGHHRAFEDAGIRARVEADFAAGGGDASRLRFRQAVAEQAAHLSAYLDVDVALDTFPFNGSTSTFEALWMGVPVVTLAGTTLMGRWAAAQLVRVGLAGLVARDADGYVALAASLVRDRARLAELRAGLRARVAASALCDERGWVRRFERVLAAVAAPG
jgi:predicted O-linked N-acetylglucosamine transferase (SPINDLY family)